MPSAIRSSSPRSQTSSTHQSELFWRALGRHFLMYFLPLLVLAVYFHLQYGRLAAEGRRTHLSAVAEHQANTLELFLRERVVNLQYLIGRPRFESKGDVVRVFVPELRDSLAIVVTTSPDVISDIRARLAAFGPRLKKIGATSK